MVLSQYDQSEKEREKGRFMRALAVQNIECEPMGALEEAFSSRGFQIEYVRAWAGQPVPPEPSGLDAVVILGGPMAVYEGGSAAIDAEIRLAGAAIREDKPLLGICLGSQIIAAAAGARVYAGDIREVGWSEVELTADAASDPLFSAMPSPLPVFQLHGDTFDLPPGAVRLAGGSAYANQAFRIGANVYGLQFHVEVTPELLGEWTRIYADYISGGGIEPRSILKGLETRCRALAPAMAALSRWLERVS